MKKLGLTNNQLKLIAMLAMTVDHIGYILFPRVMWMRMVGRLAFPIFAYMIAEGCAYTKNINKYLVTMGLMALASQVVDFAVTKSLYMNIMITFTMSISLIILVKNATKQRKTLWWILFGLGVAAAFVITQVGPRVVEGFGVDYDFIGVILPVCVYLAKNKWTKLGVCTLCLCLLPIGTWWGQWLALLAIPLLALYNNTRGKWRIKWLFYFYYPLHLAVLWLIAILF